MVTKRGIEDFTLALLVARLLHTDDQALYTHQLDPATRFQPQSNVMSSDLDLSGPRKRPRTQLMNLACPFLENNPSQHPKCRRHQLTKMSYVKQHIARVHQMPLHCQICNEVFQTEDQLREHVRSTSCEPQPYTPPDAVTDEQTIQLRSRADHKKTTEDQWYEVFDILFPGRQRPTSVYLEPDSQDLDEFVHFLTSDGTGIILNRLTPLIDGYSSNSFPGLLSALNGALQEVYGQWRWRKHVEGRSSIAPEVTQLGHHKTASKGLALPMTVLPT